MGLPVDLCAALETIAATPRLLVTSDYDGTIAPFVSDPSQAFPREDAIELLNALADLPDTAVALVSGRARDDLAVLSGAGADVQLVGSHGAEFAAGFTRPQGPAEQDLHRRLHATLQAIAADRPGVSLEVKPASIAVHVRNAAMDVGKQVLELVRLGPATWSGVQVTEGKAVIELAVIETDKGLALNLLREQHEATAVVFFGDDVTDEKAFRVLRADDVGVKVGEGVSAARYRVGEIDDVLSALRVLLDLRSA
ncbi:trehalose-phosphatase [Rhodococcus sp. X156]|uniref:trehalose-phosphatase n=1 Tax=Rhodococcus sp. X156 TaxID=2499145 RepID=UPI000FD9DBFF|nr:trehalose-phosphatase [Rhodococcus sp. X156]